MLRHELASLRQSQERERLALASATEALRAEGAENAALRQQLALQRVEADEVAALGQQQRQLSLPLPPHRGSAARSPTASPPSYSGYDDSFLRSSRLARADLAPQEGGGSARSPSSAPARFADDAARAERAESKVGSLTNCTKLDPEAYCGVSSFPAAVFTDGSGCSCDWGYDYDNQTHHCDKKSIM